MSFQSMENINNSTIDAFVKYYQRKSRGNIKLLHYKTILQIHIIHVCYNFSSMKHKQVPGIQHSPNVSICISSSSGLQTTHYYHPVCDDNFYSSCYLTNLSLHVSLSTPFWVHAFRICTPSHVAFLSYACRRHGSHLKCIHFCKNNTFCIHRECNFHFSCSQASHFHHYDPK